MSQTENEKESSCAESQNLQAKPAEKEIKSSQAEGKEQKDSDTYNQVLEKLEIKPENKDIQEKSAPVETRREDTDFYKNQENLHIQKEVENVIAQDFQKIESLMKFGLINSWQGQNLKNQIIKKAFDLVLQNEKIKQNPSPAFKKDEVFSDFETNNPNFFQPEGRKEVLDYLKSDAVIIGKDDLKKISDMIENIEKTAIERYLQKDSYEKNLQNSNELAKQKLTANAQNSNFQDKNLSRTFTREQIGKMSSAEFTKYEPLIMEQLKKGLIK
ncbi:MAG TPA: hypothetical protein PLG15_00125 [Candidatus Gastranaerophilaceae bacterium]|nr:hypothetical protein [Candidatus Gastranaerophilaceae bacterium]HPT40772.1 hypothetical protein [Candidatus Gastranaerophilaceae bacterium]